MSQSQFKRVQNFLLRNPLASWIRRDDELVVWRMDVADFAPARLDKTVAHNSWSHLERFEQTERWLNRDQFLQLAEDRIKHGGHIFSTLFGDTLGSFVWATEHKEMVHFNEVDQDFLLEARSSTFYHVYSIPKARGRGLAFACYTEALKYAFDALATEHAYEAVRLGNAPAEWVSEKLGFRPTVLLYRYIRAGRVSRGRRGVTAANGK